MESDSLISVSVPVFQPSVEAPAVIADDQPVPSDWREYYRTEIAALREKALIREAKAQRRERMKILEKRLMVVTGVSLFIIAQSLFLWVAWLPAKIDSYLTFSWYAQHHAPTHCIVSDVLVN